MSLLLSAIAYASGVYASPFVSVFLALLFVICFIITALILSRKNTYDVHIIALILIFIAGIAAGKAAATDERSVITRYAGHYVSVTGRVCELPQEENGRYRYVVDVRYLNSSDGEHKIREKLLVNSGEKLNYNETAVFKGFIKKFPESLNENGFDVSHYYRTRRIAARMNALSCEICPNKIKSYTPYALATYVRYSISQLIDKYYAGDKAAVLKAVIIGDKSAFSDDFERLLTRTGTKRLFYPAFLHIMLIGMLVGTFCAFAGKKKRDIIMLMLLIIYLALNCNQYSCVKSAIIAAGVILSKRIYGAVYMPDVIAAAVLIIGITNPMALTDSGFIMSVTATSAVAMFYPVIKKKRKPKSAASRMLIIYIICQTALLPFNACYFGTVSVWAFIAQLVFLPAAAGIILLSPLFLMLLWVFRYSFVIGWIINTLVYILMYLPKLIDKLYMSRIVIRAFSLTAILAYYLFCFALYYHLKGKARKKAACLIIASGFMLNLGISELSRIGTVELNFVNVGQGDGAFIEVPFSRSNIIIDGGGSGAYSDYDVGENVFVPFLQSKGVSEIDTAFVSHYHKDHAQGIVAAINNFRVKNVFMPDVLEDCEWRTAIEEAAENNGAKIWYVSEDTKITYKNGLVIKLYVPQGISLLSGDENDTSLFMDVIYGDFNCLFTGDMTRIEEREMLSLGKVHEAEVLKVAHHGSAGSSSLDMIQAVSPEISVISVGENNEYGLPNDTVLDALKESIIYRTDKNGNIKLTADKNGIRAAQTYKGEFGYGEE